ncbi:hypothetical protein CMV_029705 [Castanea mollissima]|uniref:TIR domain-containing protein n=1 Tax=Castanea mollissima TaxID=60419 RepID=A0A8J4VD59_9ROSI|nr:hypothetical protein CMV_029705 [Castanea mollissima]
MALVTCEGASSVSFTHQPKKFDVFLSFRGEDTRLGFIGHLYNALCQQGINTFIDDNLQRGEEISVGLLKVIESSRISIIVFSENYASSKWCMDELAKIVECKKKDQLVLPVFYNIDPSEVRNQEGKFGEALSKHEEKLKDYKVQSWREALFEAANISGWHYKHSCNEFEFIQGIVEEISNFKVNRMPEIIRRESPRMPGKRSRLWCYEDVHKVLTQNMGSEKIRGIRICSPEPSKMKLEPECLEKMKNLKFLIVSNVDIFRGLKYLPNELRVLDWSGFPLSSLPSNFDPQKLIALNMPESRVTLDKLFKKIQCRNLTYMNFNYNQCIRELPDLSSATPNIKNLDLQNCRRLVKIHDSIGCLDKLESWDLWDCIELQTLPSRIVMKSLKYLNLFECVRVKRFPNIPQEMENLKYLNLGFTSIRELPPSIENLIGLERLDIGSNINLCHLPSSIYKLQQLRILILYGNFKFPKDLGVGRQVTACNSYSGFSKYCFPRLNFLKRLTSCFTHPEKCLLSGSEDLNLRESIIKFNRLNRLVFHNSKFLKKIPKLPESIRQLYLTNCISLNSESLRKLIFQFGRILGLSPNMKCSGVKDKVLINSHSHRKLSNQIDCSSRVSLSKFYAIQGESFATLDKPLVDFGERYDILVPRKKIPNWINHQSTESSISFWVGPEFPSIAIWVTFHLVPLKDSYANNDKYGSIRDDIIDFVCDIFIFTNSRKQGHPVRTQLYEMKCDHLWFYGEPHSQLQRDFGDLMQGDQNHVEISCKIDHWVSRNGKYAPVIARMGVHVECICPPQNSVIIQQNSQNVDDNTELLAPLLSQNGSQTDSDAGDPSNSSSP